MGQLIDPTFQPPKLPVGGMGGAQPPQPMGTQQGIIQTPPLNNTVTNTPLANSGQQSSPGGTANVLGGNADPNGSANPNSPTWGQKDPVNTAGQASQNVGHNIGQAVTQGIGSSLGAGIGKMIASFMQKKPSMSGTSVGNVNPQGGADGGMNSNQLLTLR